MLSLQDSKHWRLVVLFLTALSRCDAASAGDTWPTLHNDYQRSGYTEQYVEGPYERKWFADFHDEMIATRCEAIVAEQKVFVGTMAGNVYALDVHDGTVVWKFEALGRVGASPCYNDGKLYIGSDDAFDRGSLYCINAQDGRLLWRYQTSGGVWTSPACERGRVYVGDRAGVLHAVETATGAQAWTLRTASMILKPVSLSVDGERIVCASEDMHVYCLSRAGALHWKSKKLSGLSLRDQAPTIWKGLVIVRTNPAENFHAVLDRHGHVLHEIQRRLPRDDHDKVLLDKWGDLLMTPRPERRQAEQLGVVEYLREHPHDQTFYALDLNSGTQPWIAPVFFTSGLHNPPTPPTFHQRTGELYTLYRTALTHYVRGVRRYSGLGRIDRQSGLIEWTWPDRDESNWQSFPMIPDETQALSIMGQQIIGTHQGTLASLNISSGSVTSIYAARDSYAGIFGPGVAEGGFDGASRLARDGYLTGMPNEWHGPDRSICSAAAGRIFWIAGSQVVCIGGPDVPATSTGGTKPPPLIARRVGAGIGVGGGNVVAGEPVSADRDFPVQKISVTDLRAFLKAPAPRTQDSSELAVAVRRRLSDQVHELIQGDAGLPWAPLVVELGISGEERHFWRTAETMQVLALALPHLPADLVDETKRYLLAGAEAGWPLRTPIHALSTQARREPFELGPGMREYAASRPSYKANIEDVYGLWAYAHYAGDKKIARAHTDDIKQLVDEEIRRGANLQVDANSHNDLVEHLNARMAGTLAAARLLEQAGEAEMVERAIEHLAQLTTSRIDHERTNRRLVWPTRVASKNLHQAKVPRYLALTPEVSAMLGLWAGDPLGKNLRSLREALPVWGHAWGERLIGGENYISSPHLARSVFMAWSDGAGADPKALAANLDQPSCKADLYYIEKLTALLRRLD